MPLTSSGSVGRVRSSRAPNQSEYTLIPPSDCPTNQDHLSLHRRPDLAPLVGSSDRDALVGESAAINPIIYAEASIGFSERSVLDRHLDALTLLRLPLPYEAAFAAGKAFLRCRRAGGQRSAPLADFYIGAHAQTQDLTLLTRDPNRDRTYFPAVRLIAPPSR